MGLKMRDLFRISIHSPLAGRDLPGADVSGVYRISIHSPLAGRDVWIICLIDRLPYFNPLAPRGARRPARSGHPAAERHFNPLAPRGARPIRAGAAPRVVYFNPLAPRGARQPMRVLGACEASQISIHSPLAGRDCPEMWLPCHYKQFQSTRPSRGETARPGKRYDRVVISIHSPLAGRDKSSKGVIPTDSAFQSTRPSRGETL